MAESVCVLYDNPIDVYLKVYAHDAVVDIKIYRYGQTVIKKTINFIPCHLLVSVSGELDLCRYLKNLARMLIVTFGKNSRVNKKLHDFHRVQKIHFYRAIVNN